LRRRRRAAVEATELGTARRAPHPALGARGGRLAASRADRVARVDGAGPARLLRRRRLREERRQQRVDAVEDRRHDAAAVVEPAAQLLARLLAAGATPLASHVARELAGVRLEMLREAARLARDATGEVLGRRADVLPAPVPVAVMVVVTGAAPV